MMQKDIKMRELTADDLGLLFAAISAVGSDEIAAMAEDPAVARAVTAISSGGTMRDVGALLVVKIVAVILKNYGKCEPILKQLLASLTGKSEEEIGKTSAGTYAAMLRTMFTSQGMRDFFMELLPSAAEEESQDSKN